MTGNGLITSVNAAGMAPLRARVLRVEKARRSGNLNEDTPRGTEDDGCGGGHRSARNLSQSDTHRSVPPWHGARLDSAFVAQVLGQRLHADRDLRSVFSAYEEIAPAGTAPLLERTV